MAAMIDVEERRPKAKSHVRIEGKAKGKKLKISQESHILQDAVH